MWQALILYAQSVLQHTKIHIRQKSLYKKTVLHNIQPLKYKQSDKTSDTK